MNKVELLGRLLSRSPVDIGNGSQNRPQTPRKNAGDSPICKGMGLAHEASANDADANVTHIVPIAVRLKP
jgi:hypothetical protein